MITLYSYPGLFGVADNNPYGLKAFAFLRLCRLPFEHRHVLDPVVAPRGQLPYIVDDGVSVGDSDAIIVYLTRKYRLSLDSGLTRAQRDTDLMARRVLDDLYWVMSYSRWSDDRFWPLFKCEFLKTYPSISESALEAARKYNSQRYYYQGIGRYDLPAVYDRGIADLSALGNLVPEGGYVFAPKPTSLDASIYGFVANIFFYRIETPLKAFVATHPSLVRHCNAMHAAVS